jgi:hypothetical protein
MICQEKNVKIFSKTGSLFYPAPAILGLEHKLQGKKIVLSVIP